MRKDFEDLLDKEELKWAQKVRNNWKLYGDRNTKYFQTIVKQRKEKKQNSSVERWGWQYY